MPDTRRTCPACGGTGRMHGDENAMWCTTCGGAGHVEAGSLGRSPAGVSSGVGLGGTLSGLGSLLFLVTLVAAPVVALVVVTDWLVVLAGPLRGALEALPGDLRVVTTAGGEGDPLVVTVLAGVAVVALLVLLGLRLGRTVQRTESMADVWRARGWGLLLALTLVVGPPLVLTVWAVGSGRDLEQPETVPTLTHPALVGVVVLVVLAFAWLWTGRRYVVAQRRAERAQLRAARAGARPG